MWIVLLHLSTPLTSGFCQVDNLFLVFPGAACGEMRKDYQLGKHYEDYGALRRYSS